jgi:uncharacterized lipoprotein YddW (UPF0748 family)
VLSIGLVCGCAGCATQRPVAAPAAAGTPITAIWVTRWDYRTADDVRQIIDNAAALGVTDVLWQARGQADAFYRSDLEPWGSELMQGLPAGSKDPGYDPLALAVERAHAHGIRIHAWVNVFPLWKGVKPPTDRKHPYNAHPDWRLRDSAGKAQPLNDHYVIANPVLPDVHDHFVAVCKDILMRYKVDGLHLDYVRFVSEKMDDPNLYPGDPVSLAIFKRQTGRASVVTSEDKAAYRDWKRDRITALVRRVRREVINGHPGVAYTAAVWRRPDLGHDQYLQDAALWLREGTLDRVFPMAYTDKNEQFKGDIDAWMMSAPGKPVTPGLGVYLHKPGQTAAQVGLEPEAAGFAVFGYSTLFKSAAPEQKHDAASDAERAARREEVAGLIRGRGGRMAGRTP